MFCPRCGNTVSAEDQFCRACGNAVGTAPALAPSAPPVAGPPVPAQTSGKAIASLAFGLFLFAFPLSIVAIILGHLSLSEIRKSAGRLKGQGMAIAGLVLGYLGVAGIPIILIIAAIAIPNLLRARMAANEASAASSVRTLVTAEISYASMHENAGYTCALSDLAKAGLIDSTLASGQKLGYAFELSGCTPGAEGTANGKFQVVAYPVQRNTSGTRTFCSDESATAKAGANASVQDCLENGSPL